MKKKCFYKVKGNISFLILLSTTLSFSACKKYLDVVPREFYTEADVFADVTQAEKEVAVLYNKLPWDFTPDGGSGTILSAVTDEGYPTLSQSNANIYIGGGWTSDNDSMRNFNEMYRQIRIGYHFLENIDKVPVKNADQELEYKTKVIPRYKCEVKFLIAYYYFLLFERYGPVSIIDRYYNVNENDAALAMPRNDVNATVNFIVKLCNEAAQGLPVSYSNDPQEIGRATKGAALALKAKVLLYAASPMFNGGEVDGAPVVVDGAPVKSTLLSVKNLDGSALFNTNYDAEKWKTAIDAIKNVIDLNAYKLNDVQRELFTSRNYTEVIWFKQGGGSSSWETGTMPNGTDYGGTGGLSTPQEMIDAYETDQGYPINDPSSKYTSQGYVDTIMNVYRNRTWQKVSVKIRRMYFKRDPRFYTDQYFNGMPLLGRNVITDFVSNKGTTQDGWGKSGQSTRTGYYVQKWNDPTQNLKDRPNTNYRNFPFIRYADVLLWYAEALNEYGGPSQDAYDAINKVRNRVGMPSLPIIPEDRTKAGLRKRIQNERRIELAYEGARYFDIRRWLIASSDECKKITGMSINDTGDSFYKVIPVLAKGRAFPVNYYLSPIPSTETAIAPNLAQNYGWGR